MSEPLHLTCQAPFLPVRSFLYILGANKTQVQVMTLAGQGKAATTQNVDISSPAKRAGLTISGLNLQSMTTFIKG
jgi:hypothetical protein